MNFLIVFNLMQNYKINIFTFSIKTVSLFEMETTISIQCKLDAEIRNVQIS